MEAGSYVIAISTGDNTEFDINVTTEFEETDVPDLGETVEKPIVMEGINTGYTSAGKVWYTIETPYAGTVSITVTGDATVLYGTDPENLAEYEAPFVDEYGYTTYYICVESVNDAEIVVNVEAPVGSIEKPLDLVAGENSVSTQGGWVAYYAVYMPTVNGTITITFDAETYATVQIMTGGNPYMMYTPVANGGTIQVYAWTECYIGITTSDFEPVEFTLTLAFEEEVLTPPEPEGDIGDKIGTIDVETTDTYGYFDMYTYTAEKAGKYTFFVPGKLGFYSTEKYDAFADAEADFNSNLAGAYVTVELAAGEEFSFYVGATTKGEWTIDVYCVATPGSEAGRLPEVDL